jgi:hypothetical protein
MTVEIHYQDGQGGVSVTERDMHTLDSVDMLCAWNVTPDGRERLVKFPRENVVKVIVLDDDEMTVSET